MDAAQFLRQLGQDMGLPLTFDNKRSCRLIFDGKVEVDIENPESAIETLFLSAAVGVVPSVNREAAYLSLLEANLFGRGTDGFILAVDSRLDEILLTATLPLATTSHADAVKTLERFIKQAGGWTERLATFAHRSASAGDAADTLPTDMLRV